jgi:hypothetical protein
VWPCWDLFTGLPLELWRCDWLPGAMDAYFNAMPWAAM